MWDVPAFKAWLTATQGSDAAWQTHIVPGMKRAVETSLRCCQGDVVHRRGTCQLYGYDFVVDERLQVWLLEVNSSPSMEYSTPVTQRLCAQVQEDVLKVSFLITCTNLSTKLLRGQLLCTQVQEDVPKVSSPVPESS